MTTTQHAARPTIVSTTFQDLVRLTAYEILGIIAKAGIDSWLITQGEADSYDRGLPTVADVVAHVLKRDTLYKASIAEYMDDLQALDLPAMEMLEEAVKIEITYRLFKEGYTMADTIDAAGSDVRDFISYHCTAIRDLIFTGSEARRSERFPNG